MSKYKLDLIDIDTQRYVILNEIFGINRVKLSQELGFSNAYIQARVDQDLINLKDVFILKQHVGEELFNKGLEKLALIEIMQDRNKGYKNRSKYQIARHISELSDLVLEQKQELIRIKDLLDDWDKDHKPSIKVKMSQIPEFVEEYEQHEKENGLSDENMSYANLLELVKEFDKNELRDLFKELGFSKNDELAIILHYLKNNGLHEVMQIFLDKMLKIKKDKIEMQPIQNEISEEILESPVSQNSENIENSQFTILNEVENE